MEEQIRAQQAKLAALDSRLAAKAQANQQLVEKRREVEAQSAAARPDASDDESWPTSDSEDGAGRVRSHCRFRDRTPNLPVNLV